MANSKSAEKRIIVNERNRLENKFYKSSVRTLTKMFFISLKNYKELKNPENKNKVQKVLNSAYSMIDKAAKKNVLHKNTAARKKSKLASYLKTEIL